MSRYRSHEHWRPGFRSAPGHVEQVRQLTEARTEFAWLRAGSVTVRQQAPRDFARAMRNFFAGTPEKPTWQKAGCHEGFRQDAIKPEQVRRLSRNRGKLRVPKVGWVRFRWSRNVPGGAKSYRVTEHRAGRWQVAFAVAPDSIRPPGNGHIVGVDRGVAVSAALSTGDPLTPPTLSAGEQGRSRRRQRRLARAEEGSNRRRRVKRLIARLRAREADRRKDRVENTSTDLARRFDIVRIEHLDICGMAVFRCRARGHQAHADVNAARNIAAGRAVTARGALQPLGGAVNREPQPATSAT